MTNTYYDKNIKFINANEINIPKNIKPINVVSLFSGVGGMDLGFVGDFKFLDKIYSKNPFKIIFANDIFKQAADVYEYNFKHKVERESITELDLNFENVDVVLGGFPCQTFSYSGKRNGLSDPRGQLYKEMIRVINKCRPKMFIAENVDGIRNSKKDISGANVDQSALDTILGDFENSGYDVQYHVLNAADYGVPQIRRRVIIIGIRKDLGDINSQYYPAPTYFENNDKNKWITSEDAIQDLWNSIDKTSIPNHTYKDFSKAKFYPGKKMQGNNRILANKPAPTIRAEHHGNIEGHYNYIGQDEHDVLGWRRLSVRECARLQSFPDSFNFISSASSSYKMIGNAVPPVMAWNIARAVFYSLEKLGCIEKNREENLV
ncbi:DNA (cytosine-5-)-methyltransferase [Mammaliicoccus fleurettii]|uniref:DNA cytosine methyltransferase n=1 Tax=Mammaliicoccus fleurettii TaxID=150056 RepID=UPI002DBF8315|nr:DNA (cytosine-5-)-methyltransferase [Mammaliicoccus fleurettii]MEB7781402.1 DNA (cytosine-5-)-methyltransferase [Mammaliicoccus fleurettii]